MLNRTLSVLLTGLITLGLSVSDSVAWQPEVELKIVDQNGHPAVFRATKATQQGQTSNNDIEVSDGKIVIVDENGKRREIDVTGAQSIIVNKSISSIMQDGDEERKVSGKAIIIGPDGQRQEIELGDGFLDGGAMAKLRLPSFLGDGNGIFKMPGNMKIDAIAKGNKYAIGILCNEISESLRAHVDIEDGIGLVVVREPMADSPASSAGIQKHDILVYANQTPLATQASLAEAVQTSAEENKPLELKLLRKGKEMVLQVTPAERESFSKSVEGLFQPGRMMRFEEFGPGFILDDQTNVMREMNRRMDELEARIQQHMEENRLFRDTLSDAFKDQDK